MLPYGPFVISVLPRKYCGNAQWLSSLCVVVRVGIPAKRSIVKSGHDERARFGDKVDLRGSRTVNWITKCGESCLLALSRNWTTTTFLPTPFWCHLLRWISVFFTRRKILFSLFLFCTILISSYHPSPILLLPQLSKSGCECRTKNYVKSPEITK